MQETAPTPRQPSPGVRPLRHARMRGPPRADHPARARDADL